MQGHGYAQPAKRPPHPAVLVFLRVLFVAIGVLSIGFLAWVLLLRLAVVTRRSLDWGLFVAVLVADILSVVLLAAEPGDEIHTSGGYFGLFLLLGALAGASAYYLVADVRHFRGRQRTHPGHAAVAYGYPGPSAAGPSTPFPPAAFPADSIPHAAHAPVAPPVPVVPAPVPGPPTGAPQRYPAPARIDQVRAELDELSDYLRKHEGGR